MNHGTRSRYNDGCRCDACREANRAYAESRRRAAGAVPLEDYIAEHRATDHGRAAVYQRGCRCEECRAWNSREGEKKRRRAGAKAVPARGRMKFTKYPHYWQADGTAS